MATKSILKNVNIKGRRQVKRLVEALEHAQQHKGKHVSMSRAVTEIKADKVNDFLSDYL